MYILVIWPSLDPFICNVFDFFLSIQFLLNVFALLSVQCIMKTGLELQSLSQAWMATELYHGWAENKADMLALAPAGTVLILSVY